MTPVLPTPVLAFVEGLSSANSPAYLQVNARHNLVSLGGALARYSLDTLTIGDSVTQQFPMLEGVLEQNQQQLHFERVQLLRAQYASVDVFVADGSVWVLLTDTTMRSQMEQQVQQRRLGRTFRRQDLGLKN